MSGKPAFLNETVQQQKPKVDNLGCITTVCSAAFSQNIQTLDMQYIDFSSVSPAEGIS